MSFLYPAFLIGALAVAIPVVLHLLRRDVAPEVPFTAVRLLRRSPVERSKRRRLRDILLLAARVAALVLLAAAFARPYAPGAAAAGIRVVAVDRSYSMDAPGRFAQAVELARAAIGDAAAGERVALIAFDDRAEVVAPPGSASDAHTALREVRPGSGATRYAPVVEKALELAAGGSVRLVLVSDMQRRGWEDEQPLTVPPGSVVELREVAQPAENLAVAAVRLEADAAIASIANTGLSLREGTLRASIDGRQVSSAPFQIASGATADVPLALRTPGAGILAVAVDDPEGLQADNVRYVVLEPAPQAKVLIVTAGAARQSGFYLARALESSAGEDGGFGVTTVAGTAVSALTADELAAHSAVVLLSTRGLDRSAREAISGFVRGGGGLLTAAAPDLEPSVLSSFFDWKPPVNPVEQNGRPLTFAATDLRHPIFRPFGALSANLGQVRFERSWRVRAEGWTVAARFSNGAPALLERAEGSGRVVLFASDLDRRWNDFPLHPGFVPFAIESVRHASREVDTSRDYTPDRAPQNAGPQPGPYRVGPEERLIAVNVDIRESTLTRMTADEFDGMVRHSTAGPAQADDLQSQQTEARQSYWWYGLVLMLLVLVVESFVGRV